MGFPDRQVTNGRDINMVSSSASDLPPMCPCDFSFIQIVWEIKNRKMIYEYLFNFFDSVSTGAFIVWFVLIYFSLHYLAHKVLLQNAMFRSFNFDKQTSILTDMVESSLLVFIRWEQKYFRNSFSRQKVISLAGLLWPQCPGARSASWTRGDTRRTSRCWSTWPPCTSPRTWPGSSSTGG